MLTRTHILRNTRGWDADVLAVEIPAMIRIMAEDAKHEAAGRPINFVSSLTYPQMGDTIVIITYTIGD